MFIQLLDDKKVAIISMFLCCQDDEDLWPNQGELADVYEMISTYISATNGGRGDNGDMI